MTIFNVKKNGKYYQRGFCYRLGIITISGISIGIKKVDLRITIRWGW